MWFDIRKFSSAGFGGRATTGLLLAGLAAVCLTTAVAGVTDFSPGLLHYVAGRWGSSAEERLQGWGQFVATQQQKHTAGRVDPDSRASPIFATNRFWGAVPYLADRSNWGVDDYWATPIETLGVYRADCEDYAIGKYFTLKELGVPISKLRITYVRALRWNEPHMVLAYYPEPDAEPYILDNLTDRIDLASDRRDLDPIYSFNDEDLWTVAQGVKSGKSSQIRLWRGLIEKMEKEQKM